MKSFALGLSIYGNCGFAWMENQIKRAQSLGMKYIFTSLHIPEENQDTKEALNLLLTLAHAADLEVIADISPVTLQRMGYSHCLELIALGVDWWRLDYGFDSGELMALCRETPVMLNASLLDEALLRLLQTELIPKGHLAACHNFYPKPYSGLTLERVKEQNRLCHHYGVSVFGFIAGDGLKRGPIEKGLPTVEKTRWQRPLVAALQLIYDTECDAVMVGDPDCTSESWRELGLLAQNTLQLRANLLPTWDSLYNTLQQEREDSSTFVIRSQTSRQYAQIGADLLPTSEEVGERKQGSIWIANQLYRRYSGEIEIARVDLPADPWQNYVGQVIEEDLALLDYVRNGLYFSLKKSN